jgi:hypothetical protein
VKHEFPLSDIIIAETVEDLEGAPQQFVATAQDLKPLCF